jgi:adenylosuccinate lyase
MSQLSAISPIDGRYHKQTAALGAYFSEYALIRYRVLVEVHYFLFLGDKKFFKVPVGLRKALLDVVENFSEEDAAKIKTIEATTNHDVKAVEYFLKEILDQHKASALKEWIHFGLTSQDINNTAIPLSWKNAMESEILPAYINLQNRLYQFAKQWKKVPLLARTHGQSASPTTLGKEIMVFVERINHQIELFSSIPYAAKFGGATGN